MKKYILSLLLFISVFNAYSQYKGNSNKARSYLGKVELTTDLSEKEALLTDAKGEVDAAIQIEKNRSKADTWVVRGNVYAEIAKIFPQLDNDAIDMNRLHKLIEAKSILKPGLKIKIFDLKYRKEEKVYCSQWFSRYLFKKFP